jgi:hypothetical protein
MPEMDILVSSRVESILAMIQAYMLWPENEERRQTYIAENFLHAIAALEDLSDEQIGAKILSQLQGMTAEQLDAKDLDAEAVHNLEEMAAGDGCKAVEGANRSSSSGHHWRHHGRFL